MSIRRVLFTSIFMAASTLSAVAQGPENKGHVSLLQLLSQPDVFNGKRVTVYGYCRLNFEATAIYLYKEDFIYGLSNSVWLEMSLKDITPGRRAIRYCVVEGTYRSTNRGHMGQYSGAIEHISRYESWPPKPRVRKSASYKNKD